MRCNLCGEAVGEPEAERNLDALCRAFGSWALEVHPRCDRCMPETIRVHTAAITGQGGWDRRRGQVE